MLVVLVVLVVLALPPLGAADSASPSRACTLAARSGSGCRFRQRH